MSTASQTQWRNQRIRREKLRAKMLKQARSAPIACHMCGHVLDADAPHMDPRQPVVDHLVPLSKGGDPFATTNVALACRSCNARRGDKDLDATPDMAAERELPTREHPRITHHGTEWFERGPRGEMFRCFVTNRTVV